MRGLFLRVVNQPDHSLTAAAPRNHMETCEQIEFVGKYFIDPRMFCIDVKFKNNFKKHENGSTNKGTPAQRKELYSNN